ncbi:MAG: iron-sulfur cluster assembly scaffold protein, partial [Thermomicrobiales bacterium]
IAILVENDRVAAARFRTFGCSAAIAASSVATTLIEGRAVVEAAALAPEAIVTALGGLPANKLYAPQLAADAVHRAVADWRARASGERTG